MEHTGKLAENEVKMNPINIKNHSYFNLAGHGYESGVMDHLVSINADQFTPSNERSLPSKEVLSVDDNPSMDLRRPQNMTKLTVNLGRSQGYTEQEVQQALIRKGRGGPVDFKGTPLGLDYNFVLNDYQRTSKLRSVAKVLYPKSGRCMEALTDQAGGQLYTSNYTDEIKGKDDVVYRQRQGLCLEIQAYPDQNG